MSFESLKLNKQLTAALEELGYTAPREIQLKTLTRINGGQNVIAVGPEGCGKTTSLILGVLFKLKYAQEIAPRALILVPNKESVLHLAAQFRIIGKNTDIRVTELYPGAGLEGQRDTLSEGTDVVIGTPDRVHALYLKSGINLNKLKMFILDDAAAIVQQGFQTLVLQMAERLPKCQHIVFSDVMHPRLEKLTDAFIPYPVLAEVTALPEPSMEVIPQVLYQVPNFKSKSNLLSYLMKDHERYHKAVIFVNTLLTAESLYTTLSREQEGAIALLRSTSPALPGLDSVTAFLGASGIRLLLVLNDEKELTDLHKVPFLLHFDLPPSIETMAGRIEKRPEETSVPLAITLVTDIELSLARRIEQFTGHQIPSGDYPDYLIDEGRQGRKEGVPEDKKGSEDPARGTAFHEKKASNAKDYNLKYKDRLKMFGKKNRKNKRGL